MIVDDRPEEDLKQDAFCCAVISAPSALTTHLKIGDILVSINEMSLVGDCKQMELLDSPETYFEAITTAMKYSKLPRKLRFLRIIRPNDYFSVQTSSVFELKLSPFEAELLLNKNCSLEISNFDVGKTEIVENFDPTTASLFEVIFPLQSLGFRILPYKVIISHSKPLDVEEKPHSNLSSISGGDSIENKMMKNIPLKKAAEAIKITEGINDLDEVFTVDHRPLRINDEIPLKKAAEAIKVTEVKNDLDEVFTVDHRPLRINDEIPLKKAAEAIKITEGKNDLDKVFTVDREDLSPLSINDDDAQEDDIVSDRGSLAVGDAVLRLEAAFRDFIPLSSPPTPFESLDSDSIVLMKKNDDVSSMIATIESTSMKISRLGVNVLHSDKGSPLKSTTVSLPLKPADFKSVSSFAKELPEEQILHSVKNLALNFNRSIPNSIANDTNQNPRRHRSLLLSPYKNERGNNECEKSGFNEVQRIWKDYEIVMKENENLKVNKKDLSFLKLSSSIENQLLKHQLKEIKGKLASSGNDLEEAKIDSERKSIFMLEMFENSYSDDAAVMQADKERLELELEKSKSEVEELRLEQESKTNSVDMLELLHSDRIAAMIAEKEVLEIELQKSKNEVITLGLKFNDHLAIAMEEEKERQAELFFRKEECVSLTADILNFQAERECISTSTEMTDFRNRMLRNSQIREIEQMQEIEKLTKARLLSFIIDFDSTASKCADSESIIESFLGGRGLAINRKRRKHIAALKLENSELHDNLDTVNELMLVESALHATQKDLYTKEVETRIDLYTKAVESSSQSHSIRSNSTISTSSSCTLSSASWRISPTTIDIDISSKISSSNNSPKRDFGPSTPKELHRVITADELTRDPKIIDSGTEDVETSVIDSNEKDRDNSKIGRSGMGRERGGGGGSSVSPNYKNEKNVKDKKQKYKVGAFSLSGEDGKENKVQAIRSENTEHLKSVEGTSQGSVNNNKKEKNKKNDKNYNSLRVIVDSTQEPATKQSKHESIVSGQLNGKHTDKEILKLRNLEASLKEDIKSPGYSTTPKTNLKSSPIPTSNVLSITPRTRRISFSSNMPPSPSNSSLYKVPLFQVKSPRGDFGSGGRYLGAVKNPIHVGPQRKEAPATDGS